MSRGPSITSRFAPGDRVRIDDRAVAGHCRTPWYLRGHSGEIAEVLGRYRDPERLAYHKPGLPALTLYKVRFRQKDLWPGYAGAATDTLEADIYEPWLLRMADAAPRKRSSVPRKRKASP